MQRKRRRRSGRLGFASRLRRSGATRAAGKGTVVRVGDADGARPAPPRFWFRQDGR